MVTYCKLDGHNTVLKVVSEAGRTTIFKWAGSRWTKTYNQYSGIFSDDIPTEPIKVGGSTWKRLGLPKQ